MKVGELFAEVDVKDDKFNSGLGKMQGALASKLGVSSAAVGAAVAGVAAVGAAAVAAGAKGISEFQKFEKQMNEVFTLMPGASKSAKEQMSEDMREFTREMGVTTDEAVPALYQAISAGVPEDNVFTFLEQAQEMAVGGVANLEDSVGVLSTVVNNYGEEAVSAEEASDLLFTAVKQGVTSVPELSTALGKVVPNAAAAGVEFSEVSAAMSTMTSIMGKGSTAEATTRLRTMIDELAKSGTKANTAFKEVAGQGFREFMEGGGTLEEAMQMLNEQAGNTDQGINDLFGSAEAGQAALILAGKGANKFSEDMNEMNSSAGATEDAYDQMEKTLSRQMDKLMSAGEEVFIAIGEELAPVLADLADWVVENMPEIKRITVTVFKLIKAAILPVIDVLQGLGSMVLDVADIIAQIVDFFLDPFIKVEEWLGDFSLYEIGADIINGLIEGIKEKIMAPVNLIKGMAGDVKDAAKNILGISSPSKEFQKIGVNVTEGFEKGINSTKSMAENRVQDMMNGVLNVEAQGSSAGGPSVINLTVNQNITDRKTAEYANDDLVSKLQGRGLAGAYR